MFETLIFPMHAQTVYILLSFYINGHDQSAN